MISNAAREMAFTCEIALDKNGVEFPCIFP